MSRATVDLTDQRRGSFRRSSTERQVKYRVTSTRQELEDAFRLVYRSYLQSNLCEPNRFGMRVTPHHLLPTTECFVAKLLDETIGTISVIMDGELGLPMESVYDLEVAQKRMEGYRLAEVSCLADRRRELPNSFPVFLGLCRIMVQYAKYHGVDQLLVAVHPRHARFYQRFMAFESMGELRAYPTVRNRPAVALFLDLNRAQHAANYGRFFDVPIPEEELQPQPLTWHDREYYEQMVDDSWAFTPLGHDCMVAC